MDETPYQRSRAVKNENQPTGTRWTRNGSPERFLFQNHEISQVKSRGKRLKMPPLRNEAQKGLFMRTGLTKQEKTTDIWFDKKTPTIYICTHNTDLKNRLTAYAEQYPDQCKLTEDDVVIGCKSFEIAKGRLSFRLTAPYSEERRRAASIFAKANNSFLEK